MSQTPTPIRPDQGARYPATIRWARAKGWLLIRDAFTGEWHEIQATDAPDHWRQIASAWRYQQEEG
jgi:hypothetical protein